MLQTEHRPEPLSTVLTALVRHLLYIMIIVCLYRPLIIVCLYPTTGYCVPVPGHWLWSVYSPLPASLPLQCLR